MFALRNQIYVGSLQDPAYYFENDQISACSSSQAVALVGQELSIDVFNPVVADNEDNLFDILHFRSSDGQEIQTSVGEIYAISKEESVAGSDLINLADGTPVWYYHNGELVSKFYIETVTRQARNRYKLNCTSAIGRLQKKYHGGGLFQATTFGAVLQHIIADGLHGTGSPVIDYVIDDDVANISVSGWLPYASKRENLYQLIFANGVNIVKNIDGNPRFTFVYTSPEQAESIETSEIYNGGSVEYTKPYSSVSIMEHTYAAITDAEAVVLFDNSEGTQVLNEEIWFDQAPVIVSTLQTGGQLTLVSATENSAIISGNGTLTGVPYTHSMRTVSRTNSSAMAEKTVSVTDCTMVNLINSENLLERLYAFYCPETHIKQIKNDIVFSDQRCGKAYTFKNPYGENETAFLVNIDASASSVVKAGCEWFANFEPAGQAGLFQHVDILVPVWDEEEEEWILEGEWEVPEDVTEFKVVLIGGGTGGGSGWPGENGEDAYCYTDIDDDTYKVEGSALEGIWFGAEGGNGGAGGAGGGPGRVKVFTVENATPGDTYEWSLGEGGEGGAATGFIPDTFNELKNMLEETDPDTTYTTEQINAMLATEAALTDWSGTPNTGSAGTATTFSDGTTTWSTADNDGYTPTGGIYEPITNQYFALAGKKGIKGGKGGARKVENNGSFNWVTDGENVTGDDGTIWRGGSTGKALNYVQGDLNEAYNKIRAYGGNGAGAAVGIDRSTHSHINGGSDQSTSWNVTQDE